MDYTCYGQQRSKGRSLKKKSEGMEERSKAGH